MKALFWESKAEVKTHIQVQTRCNCAYTGFLTLKSCIQQHFKLYFVHFNPEIVMKKIK